MSRHFRSGAHEISGCLIFVEESVHIRLYKCKLPSNFLSLVQFYLEMIVQRPKYAGNRQKRSKVVHTHAKKAYKGVHLFLTSALDGGEL
jgi:hypothetical protein